MAEPTDADLAGCQAVAEIHHRLLTGIILTLVTRAGAAAAAEAVYRLFRRHHAEKFLPGLTLLGLTGLPDAVASAQYHYLSNFIGTVRVEYIYESDRKAWIRYPPPRWIFDGTAVCAVPDAVTKAMLRGWHARNGAALGNPRLGFVCTGMTTAGDSGLEGYFYEHDRPLAEEERLRFSPGETAPPFDPGAAPAVDARRWPAERLAKAERNYAMDHVRSLLQEMAGLFGDDRTRELAGHAARLVGMQYYDAVRRQLGHTADDAVGFAETLCRLGRAMGDDTHWRAEGDAIVIEQTGWRLMRGVDHPSPALFDAWNCLWEGALAVHDRRRALRVDRRVDTGDAGWRWRLTPRR